MVRECIRFIDVKTNQSNHDSQSEQWNNHVKKWKFMVKTSKPLEAWENAWPNGIWFKCWVWLVEKVAEAFLTNHRVKPTKIEVNMVFFRYTIEICLQQQEKNELILKLVQYREIRDLKY